MPKIMVFIDGTWLYYTKSKLAEIIEKEDYQIDYGKLPPLVAEKIGDMLGDRQVDTVRTFLFGSYPDNCDPTDSEPATRRRDFFNMLKERYHYEVEVFPVDFHGRRLKRNDRDANDTFEPREKCVDISLASTALYYAAIPSAYDIAVMVVGDHDFLPLLQYIRRLGKRVAIASIHGSCCEAFADPYDREAVKDFDTIWLDENLEQLELSFKRQQIKCESPLHEGDPCVWTTYQLRNGEHFYCDTCRAKFSQQKQPYEKKHTTAPYVSGDPVLSGTIKTLFPERGFGFIEGTDDKDYFFHFTDLDSEITFEQLDEGYEVSFGIKRHPRADKAGAAQHVVLLEDESDLESSPDLSNQRQSPKPPAGMHEKYNDPSSLADIAEVSHLFADEDELLDDEATE